jgi:hypothetical protein
VYCTVEVKREKEAAKEADNRGWGEDYLFSKGCFCLRMDALMERVIS